MQQATEQTTGQRVLVGVDGSDAGSEAVVQAGRLVAPRGTLELATAIYQIEGDLQHWPKERIAAALEHEGGPRLNEAAARVGPRATTRLLTGPAKQALLEETSRYRATLIAVGTHQHSRTLGSVSERVAHKARCSVLVVRPPSMTSGGRDHAGRT